MYNMYNVRVASEMPVKSHNESDPHSAMQLVNGFELCRTLATENTTCLFDALPLILSHTVVGSTRTRIELRRPFDYPSVVACSDLVLMPA